ncbi:MAG TPA: hypothetical protein VF398_01180 [bacterium]
MNVMKTSEKSTGWTAYFISAGSFDSRRKRAASAAILLLWLLIVIFVSARHEMGRDEVRALVLAIEAPSYSQLPAAINNEGHPVLWYVLLRLAYSVFPDPVILKIVNIALAFIAVLIFFRYSPFLVWQKILFIFGVFPLFEYPIHCRNYAISMVFFFAFAALYPYRKQKPLWLALILALLANTNAFACIFAAFLAAFWFLDELLMERRSINLHGVVLLMVGMSIVAAGMVASIAVALPPRDTALTPVYSANLAQVIKTFLIDLVNPGPHFTSAFSRLSNPVRNLLFYSLTIGLLIRPLAAVTFWLGTAAMCTFFSTVYGSHARHQGLVVLLMITLYWIVYRQTSLTAFGDLTKIKLQNIKNAIAANWANADGFLRRLKGKVLSLHLLAVYLVLTGIFVFHIALAAYRVHLDVTRQMSSNKAFAEYLDSHPEYDDAIIIGEPDYGLTSLWYYTSRRIYLPREERFGNINKWGASNRIALSLGELLDAAQKIKVSEGKPVLIALGHSLSSRQPSLHIKYSYNKLFTASPEEIAAFRSQTAKIAEFFRSTSDENYEVYLLR